MSGECNFCSGEHTEASCENASPREKFLYGCLDWSELSDGAQQDIIEDAILGESLRKMPDDCSIARYDNAEDGNPWTINHFVMERPGDEDSYTELTYWGKTPQETLDKLLGGL